MPTPAHAPAENPLLDAVDALTKDRITQVWVEGDAAHPLMLVKVKHPPLLTMLVDGVDRTARAGGAASTTAIPIDADALEIEAQIRDILRLWCHQLAVTFERDDLHSSLRRWYIGHVNLVRAGRVNDLVDIDVTRMVEGWVRMIERKFDPDTVREYTGPCPAMIPVPLPDLGPDDAALARIAPAMQRCGARRVVVEGEERFAIRINVTRLVAECAACGTRWEGWTGMRKLRIGADEFDSERKGVS